MNVRRSVGWVAVGLGALVGAMALTMALGQWHVHALAEQGRALVAAGEYAPALRVLLKAVVEAPGDARAHYYLGLAYAGMGLCGAAWLHFHEAVRLAPAYRRGSDALGWACEGAVGPEGPGPFDHAVQRDR